jgi:hypothetical protein
MTLMRFLFPSARSNLSPLNPGLPRPVRSACRFSQPLDGLLLKLPCGFVSRHWHSWDSPCRAFPLKTAPHSRRARIPCINVSFSSNNRRHVCWGIVRLYPPEGTCGPTNTLDIWSCLFPSPFTSCVGITRSKRPMLSWDLLMPHNRNNRRRLFLIEV